MLNETEQHIYYGNLLDIYGTFLTEKQRTYMQLYFQNDLSLAEIAEEFGVSRTAIHTQIQTSIKKMDELEAALHASYVQNVFMKEIYEAVDSENIEEIKKIVETLNKTIDWR